MKNNSKITNTPKFKSFENQTISIINKDEKNREKQSSKAPSEKSFSFRQYNNLGFYESQHSSSQKVSETSDKYAIQNNVESHTTRTNERINYNILPNKGNEISLNEIILRNNNARKKNESRKKLFEIIDSKIDLNKSVINKSKKVTFPKNIENLKKKSSSKSRNKDKMKPTSTKNSSLNSTSKNNITSSNRKEKQISNILNRTSKNQLNIINHSNGKINMENNSAKNSLERSIRKNEYSPSLSMIPPERIRAKNLNEKMDIYLDNQYSLNISIKYFMTKQDEYMDNQRDIYKALIRNLQQLGGDLKDLKENI